MSSTPTLQALAVEARDAFGEEDARSTPAGPSSFDVVVEVYALEGQRTTEELVDRRACAALRETLGKNADVPPATGRAVPFFVSSTLQFLRTLYPDPQKARKDQRLLSTLFRAHLVEARHARRPSR